MVVDIVPDAGYIPGMENNNDFAAVADETAADIEARDDARRCEYDDGGGRADD